MDQDITNDISTTNITNSLSFLKWFLDDELSQPDYDSQIVSILRQHLDTEKIKNTAGKDISKDLKDLVLALANKKGE